MHSSILPANSPEINEVPTNENSSKLIPFEGESVSKHMNTCSAEYIWHMVHCVEEADAVVASHTSVQALL